MKHGNNCKLVTFKIWKEHLLDTTQQKLLPYFFIPAIFSLCIASVLPNLIKSQNHAFYQNIFLQT